MSPKEFFKDKVGIKLNSHHPINFSLVNILDHDQKIISNDDSSISQHNTHRISFKNGIIVRSFKDYILFLSNLDKNL